MKRSRIASSLALGALLVTALTPTVALAAGGGFSLEIEGFHIIDFVIFVFLLWFFLKGPVAKYLNSRYERVKAQMETATAERDAAQAQLAEYEKLLAGLQQEITDIRAQFEADGQRERDRIAKDAEAQAARLRAQAERQLEQETAKLRQELEAELVQSVLDGAESRVRAKLTSAAQRQLFNRYIKDLEQMDALDAFQA